MQTYYVVVQANNEDMLGIEVHARKYADIAPCPACEQARDRGIDFEARLDAAYNDGLALGTLLHERGIGEFERGLFVGLGLRP